MEKRNSNETREEVRFVRLSQAEMDDFTFEEDESLWEDEIYND